jgi:L-threonylcarbamoyladenylate synthase
MTVILSAKDPKTISMCAEAIKDGQLVVLPTDTVYGVVARLSDDAIMRLYLAKNRPPDKAIPILLSSAKDTALVATEITPQEQRLIERFWPGALTLVLPKRADLPQYVSNTQTVGVRVPDLAITCDIIRAAGGALAVSSANLSGNPAPQDLKTALDQLGESIAIGVDGGMAPGQAASTVAQIQGRTVQIVREGPISKAQLEAVLTED